MKQDTDSAPGKGSYRDLDVWKAACDLAEGVYLLTTDFPKTELYGLVRQMKEAAVSVPANIAEGCARHGTAEFMHFLHVAAGSLAELVTFLEISKRLSFGDVSRYPHLQELARSVGAMLYGLIRSVRGRADRGATAAPRDTGDSPPTTNH